MNYDFLLYAGVELLNLTREKWALTFEQDYGVDHRSGYCVSINGVVYSEFESDYLSAIYKALLKWTSYHKAT